MKNTLGTGNSGEPISYAEKKAVELTKVIVTLFPSFLKYNSDCIWVLGVHASVQR